MTSLLFLWILAATAFTSPGRAIQDVDSGELPSISVGIKTGIGFSQHQGIEPREMEYTVGSTMRPGAFAGISILLPITRRLYLQQEVVYIQKGSRQDIGLEIFEIPTILDVTYDMDYIEIPVLLRYQWMIDRGIDMYSLAGFGFGLKINDRYRLSGEVSDGVETIPLKADNDMSEIDLFDFLFTYGIGFEKYFGGRWLLIEYRFDLSLHALPLPTYAEVPVGEDIVVVDNEPVPLRNQCHQLVVGIRF
ncbi:PorT family protein [bacterium]|nr:PorT family protein [bacterium]MBU1702712.1 PorT family protein [Candidatus Eisenbacteria bacterium]MBU1920669.1 PorT family protein [bacterium]